MSLISKAIENKKLKQEYNSNMNSVYDCYSEVLTMLDNIKVEYLNLEYLEKSYNHRMFFNSLSYLQRAYKKFLFKYLEFKRFNIENINDVTDKKLLKDIEKVLSYKKLLRQKFELIYTNTKKLKKKISNPKISINEILTTMIDVFDFDSTTFNEIQHPKNQKSKSFYY